MANGAPLPVRHAAVRAVSGTDSDLRKLHKTQLFQLLEEFGVPRSTYGSLPRWDLVKLVRAQSGQAAAEGDLTFAKFKRGGRRADVARVLFVRVVRDVGVWGGMRVCW